MTFTADMRGGGRGGGRGGAARQTTVRGVWHPAASAGRAGRCGPGVCRCQGAGHEGPDRACDLACSKAGGPSARHSRRGDQFGQAGKLGGTSHTYDACMHTRARAVAPTGKARAHSSLLGPFGRRGWIHGSGLGDGRSSTCSTASATRSRSASARKRPGCLPAKPSSWRRGRRRGVATAPVRASCASAWRMPCGRTSAASSRTFAAWR
jgi:hypothetical protein